MARQPQLGPRFVFQFQDHSVIEEGSYNFLYYNHRNFEILTDFTGCCVAIHQVLSKHAHFFFKECSKACHNQINHTSRQVIKLEKISTSICIVITKNVHCKHIPKPINIWLCYTLDLYLQLY